MRIKNKELRQRRHRKEQTIKAAIREAKAGKAAKPAATAESKPKAAAKPKAPAKPKAAKKETA